MARISADRPGSFQGRGPGGVPVSRQGLPQCLATSARPAGQQVLPADNPPPDQPDRTENDTLFPARQRPPETLPPRTNTPLGWGPKPPPCRLKTLGLACA